MEKGVGNGFINAEQRDARHRGGEGQRRRGERRIYASPAGSRAWISLIERRIGS